MAPCDCERPLVLGLLYDDLPPRCFLCTKPVAVLLEAEGGAGQVDAIEARVEANGDDPVHAHNELLLRLLGRGEQDQ
jgi:hypothetical protein